MLYPLVCRIKACESYAHGFSSISLLVVGACRVLLYAVAMLRLRWQHPNHTLLGALNVT